MVSLTEPATPPQDRGEEGWRAHRAKARIRLRDWLHRQLSIPARSGASSTRAVPVTQAGFVLWAPFWLGLGIALWFALPIEPARGLYAAIGLCAVAAVGVRLRLPRLAAQGLVSWARAESLSVAAMAVALIAAGFLVVGARSAMVAAPIVDYRYYGAIEGRVVGVDRSSRDRMRIELDMLRLERTSPARTPDKVRLSLMADQPPPVAGTRVMLTGHLGPPPGPAEPGGFDFRRTAWFEGLGAVGYTRSPIMVVEPPDTLGAQVMTRIRMSLSHGIQSRISGQSGAVAAALMTGDRSGISEATNEIMRISSLYHIISISGLHMSMLAGLAYGSLRLLGSFAAASAGRSDWPVHKAAAIGALATALAYLGLSGGGVATERAFLMVMVLLGAVLAGKRVISLRNVAMVALAILLVTPETLTSASFQMSFAATVALILGHRYWSLAVPFVPPLFRPIALLLFTSLVAGLATGPFAAAHFGRIAPYGMLANLLAVPVVGIIVMPMGLLAAILAPIGLSGPPLWLMGVGTGWMLDIAEGISALGGADLLLCRPPALVIPLIGAGLTIAALACEPRPHGTRVLPRLLICGLGTALFATALMLWVMSERPQILVSAEGDAVGIMTPAGRALSKPRGGAFSAANWLENDGDAARQEQAAARLLWSGPKNRREALIGEGSAQRRIIHLSGKRLPDIAALCNAGTILVTDQRIASDILAIARSGAGKCLIFDKAEINAFGGFSFTAGPRMDKIEAVNAVAGRRAWIR